MAASSTAPHDLSLNYLWADILNNQAQPEDPPLRNGQHRLPSRGIQGIEPAPLDTVLAEKSAPLRLVLAVDFGTTFTGCASALVATSNMLEMSVVTDWTPKMSNLEKVPSVISYTKSTSGEAQWGSDISEDAVTMIDQKLELELQNDKIDELNLTLSFLAGTRQLSFGHVQMAGPEPDFSAEEPEQVVTDYLGKIFQCVAADIDLAQLSASSTPIDFVITAPVCWSYDAKNSLFRAMSAAGFNSREMPTLTDTMFVSEPEAAAHFVARHYKDKVGDFLEVGKSFVLCDAGRRTVDSVAFKVTQVVPTLELERITQPTGRKCGSVFIERQFKEWLRYMIGAEQYAKLDPVGVHQERISPHSADSGPMRQLIERFSAEKNRFSGKDTGPIKLDLPTPLDHLTLQGRVYQGELTINWGEMEALMDTCVEDAIDLVLSQIQASQQQSGSRVENIFLVGGFGASPYLRAQLMRSFKKRMGIQLRCPEAEISHTAVLQGAVIYGSEKLSLQRPDFAYPILKSYGYITNNGDLCEFRWVVQKGDLRFSGERLFEPFWLRPKEHSTHTLGFRLCASDGDGDLPVDWNTGRDYVHVVAIVPFRPTKVIEDHKNMMGPFQWGLTLDDLPCATLYWDNKKFKTCQFLAQEAVGPSKNGTLPENPYADPDGS